jgi:hypothetical protein
MGEKSVSFRTHLQSNTADLLESANIACMATARLVSALVSQLAAYTEEGVPMAPAVFVCNSVTGLVRSAGAGEYVPLSDMVDTATAASKILKYAAPLCGRSWRIYVERSEDGQKCRFGVFCGSSDPSSLTIEEVTLAELDPAFPIVRIAQSVTNKVEVRTSAGDAVEFRFNDDTDITALDNKSMIAGLAVATTSAVEGEKVAFAGFMERVLTAAIRDSHGTLIAVVSGDVVTIPPELTDAVVLTEPIDLHVRYALHEEEEKTAVSVGRLQSAAELLQGFINSDGITVLNGAGKVLAYRAFIKSADPASPATGGARTRAYAAVSALVGSGLDAAFFRSQDGRLDIKISEKVGTHA